MKSSRPIGGCGRVLDWTMLRGIVLVGLGLSLLALGIHKSRAPETPARTATRFLEALKAGDRAQVLEMLQPAQREIALRRLAQDGGSWSPTPSLSFRIVRVEPDGDNARVHVRLADKALKLQPVISLCRNSSGVWEVAEISGLALDPLSARAESRNRQRARAIADSKLADELTTALRGVTGVTVLRESPADRVRR